MKAIRVHQFGGPEVLKLEEVPDPQAGAGQVVFKVHAAGVNPFETYMRAGNYGHKHFPYIPGVDAAGVVESVGEGVTAFKPGDRIYSYATQGGTYSQKACNNATHVRKLPAHISFAQGAAIGVPYATAYRALFHRAEAKPAQTVLVHGATGSVGSAAVQLARAAGMVVFGTGSTEAGRKLVKEQGACHVLDHKDPQHFQQLMDLTGGHGLNVILEMLANVNLAKDLTVLAKFGCVIVIGSRGPIEIDPRETMGRDAEIRGMTLNSATDPELNSIHAALIAGLENRTLNPIMGAEFPLADAPKAHVAVMESGGNGKIVLIP